MVSSEEGAALLKQWQDVEAGLDASMKTVVDEWKVIASADYTGPLSQPLLHRCQDNTLAVNFSPEVSHGGGRRKMSAKTFDPYIYLLFVITFLQY